MLVIEYAKISKLVHTVTSKEDQAALSSSGTSPLSLHYYEKNASDSVAMVVSSTSMKYIGVVFGGREGGWEKLRAMPLREMGPYSSNSNLPFTVGLIDSNDGDDCIVVEGTANNTVDAPNEPISTTEESKVDTTANTENSPTTTTETGASNTDVGNSGNTGNTGIENAEKDEQDEKLVDVELSGDAKREKIEIHPGINNALFSDDLHANLEKALNSVIPDHPLSKIIVTGHGMGAAMATIFAAYLCKQKPILEVSVVNFGSPRIGSDKFCKWINEISNLVIWRYIFRFDAVAGIPSVAIGFRHVGHMIHLNEGEGTKAYCYTGESNGTDSMGYIPPPELCKYRCSFSLQK